MESIVHLEFTMYMTHVNVTTGWNILTITNDQRKIYSKLVLRPKNRAIKKKIINGLPKDYQNWTQRIYGKGENDIRVDWLPTVNHLYDTTHIIVTTGWSKWWITNDQRKTNVKLVLRPTNGIKRERITNGLPTDYLQFTIHMAHVIMKTEWNHWRITNERPKIYSKLALRPTNGAQKERITNGLPNNYQNSDTDDLWNRRKR